MIDEAGPDRTRPRAERFESLDFLRGVAVLGILLVNIQAFAMVFYAYENPTLQMAFAEAGRAVWTVTTTVFTLKFITIFSALFGAGIVLMLGDAPRMGPPQPGAHTRRMLWLLLFGTLHGFFLWYGDILLPYAVAGLIVAGARRWRPLTLCLVGTLLCVPSAIVFAAVPLIAAVAPEAIEPMRSAQWTPPPEVVADQTALFRKSWLERLPDLAALNAQVVAAQVIAFLPRTLGVMMVGMALFKTGFFTLRWPAWSYALVALLAGGVGLAGSHLGVRMQLDADFEMVASFNGKHVLYWASLPHALGYAALAMLLCKPGWLKLLRVPFAAAGRMALSNYLGCTLVCVFIFFGPPGLGLFAQVERPDQLRIVLAMWAGMLIISTLWLSVFRFGPFEWVWRSLTYKSVQPFLRRGGGQ